MNAISFTALTKTDVLVKVVDVGANPIDGQPPYASMLRNGNASVVGFEPNPTALEILEKSKGPSETYLPYAVGDGRRHTLHICKAPGMTSLLEPNPTFLDLFHGFPIWGTVIETEDVDTVRLDDIPETKGMDLLKIDIQGGELLVFQNAEQRISEALIVHTEVEFLPLYKNQPLFGDIDAFLRSKGYMFHKFSPLVSRAIKPMLVDGNIYSGFSQIVWGDAIFVRDITKLDTISTEQLLRAAAILHDCYQSYDLVLHFLIEHDRRSGGNIAENYISELKKSRQPLTPPPQQNPT